MRNGTCVSNKQRTCRHCGETFARTAKGQPTKYCSVECRDAARNPTLPRNPKTCLECGVVFVPVLPNKQKCCSKPCADKLAHRNASGKRVSTCERCGKTFNPKMSNRLRFCGRKCAHQQQSDELKERRASEKMRKLFQRIATCDQCSMAFIRKQPAQRLCGSDDCKKAKARGTGLGCRLCGGKRFFAGKFYSSYCRECRAELIAVRRKKARWQRNRKKSTQTPNGRCTTLLESSRETLNLLRSKIARAKGRCRLCGLAMSKRCDPCSDRALEFDHRMPLSQCGSDQAHNLQAICRRCNGLKGAFTSPEIVIRKWFDNVDLRSTGAMDIPTA